MFICEDYLAEKKPHHDLVLDTDRICANNPKSSPKSHKPFQTSLQKHIIPTLHFYF